MEALYYIRKNHPGWKIDQSPWPTHSAKIFPADFKFGNSKSHGLIYDVFYRGFLYECVARMFLYKPELLEAGEDAIAMACLN